MSETLRERLLSPEAIEAGARAIRKRNYAAEVYNFHRADAEAALAAVAALLADEVGQVEELSDREWLTVLEEFGLTAGRYAVNRRTKVGPHVWTLTLAQMPELLATAVRPAVDRILTARQAKP